MPRDLQRPDLTVAVIGAGTMGRGIAQVCAQAGLATLLVRFAGRTRRPRRLPRSTRRSTAWWGKRPHELRTPSATRSARLRAIGSLDDVKPAGIVIEAIVEDLAAKHALMRELENRIAPEAVIATNTSSLSVTEIAAGSSSPARVGGLHFFNPPPLMRLVEVIGGLRGDPHLIEALTGFRPPHRQSTRSWQPTRRASWSITPAAPTGRRRCASSSKASPARARSTC